MYSNWSYNLETLNSSENWYFFLSCVTLKNNRAPLLCYLKLCASFSSHQWIQIGDTVRKCPIWVKIKDFFMPYDLQICQTTLKNNRTPLLCHVKLCVSSYRHMWIKTGVRVLKRVNWILTSVILTFCMAITSGNGNHSWNFMMIRWQKHCQKGVTDRRMGRQTERSVLKYAWSQLKMSRTCENPVY